MFFMYFFSILLLPEVTLRTLFMCYGRSRSGHWTIANIHIANPLQQCLTDKAGRGGLSGVVQRLKLGKKKPPEQRDV